jgi:aspartyl-tRNA synthetase
MCPLVDAPAMVSVEQLKDLHIKLHKPVVKEEA